VLRWGSCGSSTSSYGTWKSSSSQFEGSSVLHVLLVPIIHLRPHAVARVSYMLRYMLLSVAARHRATASGYAAFTASAHLTPLELDWCSSAPSTAQSKLQHFLPHLQTIGRAESFETCRGM
jgi:putative hemolysin